VDGGDRPADLDQGSASESSRGRAEAARGDRDLRPLGNAQALSGVPTRMVVEQLRLRQIRTYSREPVADDAVAELLQIARSSGSWANSQPWHFVVIRERETLRRISRLRPLM